MSVPIYQEGTQCGMLQDTTQGLYTRFSGRLKAQGLCRVYGVYPEGEISLGVPVPEGDSLRVRATLPTSRLPKGRLLSGRVVYEQDAHGGLFPAGVWAASPILRGSGRGTACGFHGRWGWSSLPWRFFAFIGWYGRRKGSIWNCVWTRRGAPCCRNRAPIKWTY